MSGLHEPAFASYVVVFFDKWAEEQISFVLGPYDNLGDAQAQRKRAEEKLNDGYRRTSIERLRRIDQIPEWEPNHETSQV